VTPAHAIRTTLAAAIAATLTLGGFAAIYCSPLGTGAAPAPVADPGGGRTLQSLLTDGLTATSLQSRPSRVSEAAPARLLSPCRHHRHGQLVTVSIKRQHAWAYSGSHTVLSTPVTTGRSRPGDATPRGRFVVEARVSDTTLRPANGHAVHVHYWIPFRENIWGFHDASWQSMPFGSSRYRSEGSLGCVHVPMSALRELFEWVHNGTTVRIH
jgi:hypothetical protein